MSSVATNHNNPAFSYVVSLLPPGIHLPSFAAMSAADDVAGTILRVNIVFLSLVGVTCASRLYVRLFMVRNFGVDDACMVLACACAVVLSVMCLVLLRYGFGTHIWTMNLILVVPNIMHFVKNLMVCGIMYSLGMTFAKLSIILSYLRLFPIPPLRRFLYILAFIVIALSFCNIWVVVFQCRPIAGAWDFTITTRKCIPIVNFLYFSAGVNIATDVALCTVPLPFLLRMSLPRRQKVGVCLLFAVGGFACVASMLRIAQLHNLVSSIDVTYSSASSVNWTVVETGTSIVCASIPSLKPLWICLVPKRWRSSKGTHASYDEAGGRSKTWGSKSGGGLSRSRVEEGGFQLQDVPDEERGIKKTVAVAVTVDVDGDRSDRGRQAGTGVFARAYSREPDREARTTWVDSAEELVVLHPDLGIMRQPSRQGSRSGERRMRGDVLMAPKNAYAR